MTANNDIKTTRDVACPFCGLLCDDLVVTTNTQGELQECRNACARGYAGFKAACEIGVETSCLIAGRTVDLEQACGKAMALLQNASMPVFGGMVTDVNGAREAIRLAERTSAIVDHLGSSALLRNQRVMQRSGWFTTTLTEIRNRADLVVIVGDGIIERFPRLVERILLPSQSLHEDRLRSRRFVTIGTQSLAQQTRETGPESAIHVATQADDLFGRVKQLRRALQGEQGTVPEVNSLAEAVSTAKYTVFIWSAALLGDPAGDLVIDALCQLVKERNETGRCAGFPIAGNDGDISVNQVCTWQTGMPLRTGFVEGKPVHDPLEYDLNRLVDENRVDTLLWISSLTADAVAPPSNAATIVLGHPASPDRDKADVFIPVETPGVGAGGLMVRTDVVVSLPLSPVRQARLPTVAHVLSQMMKVQQGERA